MKIESHYRMPATCICQTPVASLLGSYQFEIHELTVLLNE